MKVYNIKNWLPTSQKPHPKAVRRGDRWQVELTADEVLRLTMFYDVMLRRTEEGREEIWLDTRGKMFRSR